MDNSWWLDTMFTHKLSWNNNSVIEFKLRLVVHFEHAVAHALSTCWHPIGCWIWFYQIQVNIFTWLILKKLFHNVQVFIASLWIADGFDANFSAWLSVQPSASITLTQSWTSLSTHLFSCLEYILFPVEPVSSVFEAFRSRVT